MFRRTTAIARLAAVALAVACAQDASKATAKTGTKTAWGYTAGAGAPENWGTLSSESAVCSSGQRQSPIDIVSPAQAKLAPIQLHWDGKTTEIVNNGHAVQLNMGAGSTMQAGGSEWKLLQVHVHSPSENLLAGERFPLEAHFVHQNASGALAVLGIFYRDGAADAAVASYLGAVPATEGGSTPLALDVKTLAPAATVGSYVTFDGSLTTPPCSEGVTWFVATQPRTVSKDQVDALVRAVGANARPVQPLNGRVVTGTTP